ncbi:MAG: NfeD family protein [Sulfolobales archaeon]
MRSYLMFLLLMLVALSLNEYTETIVVEVTDIVDGGTVSLVQRAIERLPSNGLLVLYLNSYGGYVYSADSIAELLVTRGVECAAYVPPGGKATSAAALVAVACGRIYMAPGSVIGAARPYPDDPKAVNYVASRFRALAWRAYGNETKVDIVVRFVTEALTLTDEEATALGLAEKALSLDDVVRDLGAPEPSKIFRKDLWDRVLSVISDPLISSIAFSLGVFLIIAEVLVTGFQGYAVAGVLLIAAALYGMNIIPPDLLVLTLMLSGAVLVLVEFMSPGLQGFGIAGLILLTLGLYTSLRGRPVPTIEPSVVGVAISLGFLGAFLGFIVFKAAQTTRLRKPKLKEVLVGSIGIAKTDVGPATPGVVHVRGEEWSAYSISNTIPAGSRVVVKDVRGLFLYVESVSEKREQ